MTREVFYDVLIQFFNLDVDFNIIFQEVEQPNRSEIINFINFIKNESEKSKIMQYKLSEKSKNIILHYMNYIFKKIDN